MKKAVQLNPNLAARPMREWAQAALTLKAPAEQHSSFSPDGILLGLERAALSLGLEIAHEYSIPYEPQGLSATLFGPEFRLCIHTWPEHACATVDISIARNRTSLESFVKMLERCLGWHRVEHEVPDRMEGLTP